MSATIELVRKSAAIELSAPTSSGRHRFVLSTETPDLAGDVVVQAGRENVSARIPAQVDHSGSIRDLIGHWENIKTEGKRTTAELVLFDKGVSWVADLVRTLLDSGVRMAASIGFQSIKREDIRDPDTDHGRFMGYRFQRWKLLEGSVVVVPANPDALSFAKSHLSPEHARSLDLLVNGRAAPTEHTRSTVSRPAPSTPKGKAMTTVADRIASKEARVSEIRARFKELSELDFDESQRAELEALDAELGPLVKDVDALRKLEAGLVERATPASSSISIITRPSPKHKANPDLFVRSALCAFEAYVKRVPVENIVETRYRGDEATKWVTEITTKAAQNPAMTNVPGWAQELVRETFGAFMDLLRPESVVPRLPLARYSFDGYGSIKVPMRSAKTPNLAAAFRAEGAPIRVGALSLTSATLTPKSMGVIGTYTNELFERSTPNIEQVIREGMLADTAESLDAKFLSADAATADAPAGIQNGIGAGNTAASTGNTAANIIADLRARLQAMANAGMGRRPVWVMNPARAWGLGLATTAAGTYVFPEMSSSNTLLGVPVVTSTTVPADIVYLIDGAEVSFAGGAPRFLGTEVATIHEEDTTPLPIVSGAAPGTVANPVRSLFQTNSSALRSLWEVDWKVLRVGQGAIQTITGVAW